MKLLDIKYLPEFINLELIIGKNFCNFIILYRSPSQTHVDFETFEIKLDKNNKRFPFLTLALCDFNAKSQTWCKRDKISCEVSTLYKDSNIHGLDQLLNEPAHLLDSLSSCIDLIFTSQPKVIMESCVQLSLFTQIVIVSWYLLSSIYPSITLFLTKVLYRSTTANADLILKALRINDVNK